MQLSRETLSIRRLFISVLLLSAISGNVPAQDPPKPLPIVVEKNVPATMRDGVILRADIYRPDTTSRYPALLSRTPYSKAGGGRRFGRLSSLGFAVVVQDTRGRYTSDGLARPHDEAADGYDTVEWVASLPYVNGKVGMFGGRYLATKQLTALILNVCSGLLTECCEVDLSAEGCSSTNVGDLIDEIADLIAGESCHQAADCAAAVNEGTALDNG